MTRRLLTHTAVLALLAAGCPPIDPIETVGVRSGPPGQCSVSCDRSEDGRFQLASSFTGLGSSHTAGELSPMRLDVTLSDWPSHHLLDLQVTMSVRTGQSLPGHTLELRQAGTLLQEATVGGEHGNEANFDVRLSRDVCDTPCAFTLSLTAPRADSELPIPLSLNGGVYAFLDTCRETRPCSEGPFLTAVSRAL